MGKKKRKRPKGPEKLVEAQASGVVELAAGGDMGKRKRKRPKGPEKLVEALASGVVVVGPPAKKPALALQTATSTALEIPPVPVVCSSQSSDTDLSQSQQETPTTAEQDSEKATPSSDKRRVTRSMTRGNPKTPLTELDGTQSSPEKPKLRSCMSKKKRRASKLETIAPHSFVRSRLNDVRDSPWLSKEAFAAVYTWLYSNRTELMSKGVARVAAWSTRGQLPVGIDITAHLCEAFLMEMKYNAGNSYRAVSFGFSVAITRFINGLVEAALLRDHMGGITLAAMRFDIPQWVIDLRHESSHGSLPSAGRLRAGATFCLRWLKRYYWKQYQDIQSIQRPGSRSTSPLPTGGPSPIPLFPPKPNEGQSTAIEDAVVDTSSEGTGGGGAMQRLTRGLCSTRVELVNLLTSSAYTDLAEYLRKKQLLQFPDHNSSYTLTTPEPSDLISFSELEIGSTDLAMWKKHLLKACEQNPCFKQTLISALIVVVNSSGAGLRDYLCSWLCMLMVEQYQVDTGQGSGDNNHGIEVVQILDDDEQFLPGTLDWLTLLKVAKKHAGYYTYAIMNVILQHLKSTLAESTRERILYLTTLVTLSDRIAHDSYIPGIRRGIYEAEFKQAKTRVLERRHSEENGGSSSLPLSAKRTKLELEGNRSKLRWSTVANMSQWVRCPLGLAPGQTEISPTMFDLPAALDGPLIANSMKSTTASMVLDDRGQFAEEEGEESDGADGSGVILDTTLIENIKNQVTIL